MGKQRDCRFKIVGVSPRNRITTKYAEDGEKASTIANNLTDEGYRVEVIDQDPPDSVYAVRTTERDDGLTVSDDSSI